MGDESRVKSQIFVIFALGDSPNQGDFKMGSTTSQLQESNSMAKRSLQKLAKIDVVYKGYYGKK